MVSRLVKVGTTPTLLADLSPVRKELKIQNQGNYTIYWSNTPEVSTAGTRKGFELVSGGIASLNEEDDPVLIHEPIYAVALGETEVLIWEA